LVRKADKLGGYDEVPMAGAVRFVMFVTTLMACFVIGAARSSVTMVLMAINMPMWFLSILFLRLRSFDMDVWSTISRMAVPQSTAGPGHRTRIE
jgi:hypothetical protein